MRIGVSGFSPEIQRQVEQFVRADPQVAGDLISRARNGDKTSVVELADRTGMSVADARAVAMTVSLDELSRISADAKVQSFVASTRQTQFQADRGGRGAGATLAAHGIFGDLPSKGGTEGLRDSLNAYRSATSATKTVFGEVSASDIAKISPEERAVAEQILENVNALVSSTLRNLR